MVEKLGDGWLYEVVVWGLGKGNWIKCEKVIGCTKEHVAAQICGGLHDSGGQQRRLGKGGVRRVGICGGCMIGAKPASTAHTHIASLGFAQQPHSIIRDALLVHFIHKPHYDQAVDTSPDPHTTPTRVLFILPKVSRVELITNPTYLRTHRS